MSFDSFLTLETQVEHMVTFYAFFSSLQAFQSSAVQSSNRFPKICFAIIHMTLIHCDKSLNRQYNLENALGGPNRKSPTVFSTLIKSQFHDNVRFSTFSSTVVRF